MTLPPAASVSPGDLQDTAHGGVRGIPPQPGIHTQRAFGSREAYAAFCEELSSHFAPQLPSIAAVLEADWGSIFRFWSRLKPSEKQALIEQVAGLDLTLLQRNLRLYQTPGALEQRTAGRLSTPFVLEPVADPDCAHALALGEEVLEQGWLALVEGAGGTGSRFFKASGALPKGLYPISQTERFSFFELRLARLMALRRRYGRPIPYLVMVSDATEEDTREYFEENHYFGLEGEILIVRQRSLPYVRALEDGHFELVLETPSRVAVGGYGHADFTKYVLQRPEVQAFLTSFGTRYVQWLQIDNPLASLGHRYLLGAHRRAEPQLDPSALWMSFIALGKELAQEAAGVLVRRNGSLSVWEYSDIDTPSQYCLEDQEGGIYLAVQREGRQQLIEIDEWQEPEPLLGLDALPEPWREGLRYRWGAINPNLVVVSLSSVLAHPEDNLPLVALKKCRHVTPDGLEGAEGERFIKFEAFLFDGQNDGVVVAEERRYCFAPTKNAEGPVDSPAASRALLTELASERLRQLGWLVSTDPETIVEFTGLLELSNEELASRVGRNGRIDAGGCLSIHGLDVKIGDGLHITSTGDLRLVAAEDDRERPLSCVPQLELPAGMVVRGVRYKESFPMR